MTGAPGQGNPPRLPCVLIVAGPTCSGKSALALALARAADGVLINADSMQVYRELRVLTARPSDDEEALSPHRLYGIRNAAEAASVAWWRDEAIAAIEQALAAKRLPILVGGTGLYFAALTDGLAAIPPIGAASREEARALLAEIGSSALHARLAAADPATAATLRPSDGQRIARAWEVWRGTARGLAGWLADGAMRPAPYRFRAIRLDPPRDRLRQAIAERFEAMLAAGAIDEVRALVASALSPSLPAMRAHGVPELSAYLRGEVTLDEARARTCLVTGQYTKRQATWFRHRVLADPSDTHIIHARVTGLEQFSEREWADMLNFIRRAG